MRVLKADFTTDILRNLAELEAQLNGDDLTKNERAIAEVRKGALMAMLAPCKPLAADPHKRRAA